VQPRLFREDKLMGRAHRPRPNRLGEKLRLIRIQFGLTQSALIDTLAVDESLYPSSISLFEQGAREPSLLVLLAYSNLAGVTINELVDDKIKLPDLSIKQKRSQRVKT
jgi:transcriptional regulator with XRE-family HTH domain